MAYTRAALAAAMQTLLTADKPLLFGHNGLYQSTNYAYWANADNDTTERADSSYPSSRLFDGQDHLQSAPSGTASAWWIKCTFTGSAQTVDSLALLNVTLTNCTSIELAIADNATFTSNKWTTTLTHNTSEDPSTNTFDLQSARRVCTYRLLDSGTPQSVTSLVYAYVKLNFSAPTKPYVGEVLLGRRRQLAHAPDVPYDTFNLRSRIDTTRSKTGIVSKYVRYTNERRVDALLRTSQTAYGTDLEEFFTDDTRGGRDSFLWCDNPSTNPKRSAYMNLDEPAMGGPYVGPAEREWRIVATEAGPNYVANE